MTYKFKSSVVIFTVICLVSTSCIQSHDINSKEDNTECIPEINIFRSEDFRQFIKDSTSTNIDSFCYETPVFQLCYNDLIYNIQFYIECQVYYGGLAEKRTSKFSSLTNPIIVYLAEDNTVIENKSYKTSVLNNLFEDLNMTKTNDADSISFFIIREEWSKFDFGSKEDYNSSHSTNVTDVKNFLEGLSNQDNLELTENITLVFEYKNVQYYDENTELYESIRNATSR